LISKNPDARQQNGESLWDDETYFVEEIENNVESKTGQVSNQQGSKTKLSSWNFAYFRERKMLDALTKKNRRSEP